MPKFVKDIVKVGQYLIPSPKGGRLRHTLTPDRLRKWADNFGRMRDAGLRVPAPWKHDRAAVPVQVGEGGMLESAAENAGFWEEVWFDPDENVLRGVVDVPGDETNPETPAGKIGKTVVDTSVYVNPKFVDAKGREWNDALMHIACVTHPIEPGQTNFVPADNCAVLSMAFADEDPEDSPDTLKKKQKTAKKPPTKDGANDPAGDAEETPDSEAGEESSDPFGESEEESPGQQSVGGLGQLISLFRDVAKVALPADTTEKNLLERLIVALQQKQISEEDESQGNIYEPPEGAETRHAPFVMSFSKEQIAAVVKSGAVNPVTGRPFTENDLLNAAKPAAPQVDEATIMSYPKVVELVNASSLALGALTKQAKQNYQRRLEALVRTGRVGAEKAKEKFQPLIDGFAMSFENGEPKPQPIDTVFDVAESLQPLAPQGKTEYDALLEMSYGSLPEGAREHGSLPSFGGQEAALTHDDISARLDRLQAAGIL